MAFTGVFLKELLVVALFFRYALAISSIGKQPVEQCPEPLCDCRNLGDGVVEIHCVSLNMTEWPHTFLPRTRAL